MNGYNEISNNYYKTGKLEFIRKDMQQQKKKCRNEEEIGVDLNRNYDFAFAYDEIGSNSNPCEEDYRG